MIRWVVFDIGGVLVKVARTWGEAARCAGVSVSQKAANALLNDFSGILDYQAAQISLENYLQELARFLGTNSKEDAFDVHMNILMEEMPRTRQLINDLRSGGLSTACLSNTNATHWEKLASSDFYPNVASLEVLAASHLFGVEKPSPLIYQKFEELTGAKSSEVLFFEDGPGNVEGARAAGWNASLVDPFGDTCAQMREVLNQYGVLASLA